MKHTFISIVAVVVFASQACAQQARPRVVVLTDIANEPDDEESLVRFLVSSSDYDVEALIATTSTWLRDKVHPDKIQAQIRAYATVYPNLIKHDPRYPSAEYLLSVTRSHRAGPGILDHPLK